MPVFCILRKALTFKSIQNSGSDFPLIFENPSHFSAIFRLRIVKISLRNFRISLLDFRITLSNPKISLSDFRRVKIFAEIPQICVLFCRKSRVKTFYFFVKILYLFMDTPPRAALLRLVRGAARRSSATLRAGVGVRFEPAIPFLCGLRSCVGVIFLPNLMCFLPDCREMLKVALKSATF